MQTDALAQIYAKSLFELAGQAGGTEKVIEIGDELGQLAALLKSDKELGEFFASPIIDKAKRGESLRRMFADRITDLTLRFLLVLNQKERLGHFPMIRAAFDGLVLEAANRVEVEIYTPAPLGEPQLESIRSRIQEAIGKTPILVPGTDEAMIGGLKLRIGDQLIDGSVATQLRRVRQSLLASDIAGEAGGLARFIEEGGVS